MAENVEMENASVARRTNSSSLKDNDKKDVMSDKTDDNNSGFEKKDSDLKNQDNNMSAVEEEQQEEAEKEDKKEKNKKKNVLNRMQGAVNAVQQVHSAMMMFNIIMMLKSMITGVAALASSILGAVWNFIVGIGQAVGNFFVSVGTAIASFFGTTVSVVASFFGGGVSVVAATLVVSVASSMAVTSAVRDNPYQVDCAVNVANVVSGFEGNIDLQTELNAQSIYSVYSAAGFSDIQIAGVIANFHYESVRLDPTSVEGIMDEEFTIGPRKQAAINCDFDLSVYCPSYGYTYPYRAGVGLAGFTGAENENLCNFAERNNKNWYDLDVQIAFSISEYGGADWLNSIYKPVNFPNTDTATESFLNGYERPADPSASIAQRQEYAAEWYVRMAEWAVDADYANSVLNMANTAQSNGTNTASSAVLRRCRSAKNYDNSTLASAAVAYAYETVEEGMGNNGTVLYQTVHDNVFPGDTVYMSCDRTVACAVRWAGYDDNYPSGDVGVQLNYVISSSKWTEVTTWDGNPDNLLPGDIIFEGTNCRDHTLLYVGNEAIVSKYPNATGTTYCIVSGSYEERSPGCQRWYDENSRRVFRNVEKESNSIYTNAGAGANQSLEEA